MSGYFFFLLRTKPLDINETAAIGTNHGKFVSVGVGVGVGVYGGGGM
ncbi:MAG: hypothetical protein H7644_05155 [Candidatus Heimdallarchaeota archaeon]|nr:hypothetical protein [Candidatus Heimdallarchaeota archaeon]